MTKELSKITSAIAPFSKDYDRTGDDRADLRDTIAGVKIGIATFDRLAAELRDELSKLQASQDERYPEDAIP
jgi:septal ring factor EnvC (AmiA/AmiB activator)